jgi:capsid protein
LGDASTQLSETDRLDARAKARLLVRGNPHARNLLRLLEVYVVGPGLQLHHEPAADCAHNAGEAAPLADRLWGEFLAANRRHFSYREHARRTWRDGECFLRLFPQAAWPPAVRFVDPEIIGPTAAAPDSHGIVTAAGDVETPVGYLRIDPATGELLEEIPAAELLHTKCGADSNQKRGVTIFLPLLDMLDSFEKWRDTELQARKLQASIVLWRKVHGSPSQAAALADGASFGTAGDVSGTIRRERIRAGTILTTSQGTELEFLQPKTNFGDAVPLGRLLLLSIAAGAGLPEFMLTSDASNANYASTMVAEGPAVKLFQSEQQFFADEFTELWRRVMLHAVELELLPAGAFQRLRPKWTFPQLVSRDRNEERQTDAKLVQARVLSRAEVARRDGVDPQAMRREMAEEN